MNERLSHMGQEPVSKGTLGRPWGLTQEAGFSSWSWRVDSSDADAHGQFISSGEKSKCFSRFPNPSPASGFTTPAGMKSQRSQRQTRSHMPNTEARPSSDLAAPLSLQL